MDASELKKGMYIEFKDGIWNAVDTQFVFPGKGNAFVRTRLKNAESGKVVDHTFKANESVTKVETETANAQYLYFDGANHVFMDNGTYDQFEISEDALGDKVQYLSDGLTVLILKLDGHPLNVELPKKLKLKVVMAPPGVKGDSASGATKVVELETGMKVSAPLFIKEGDEIMVNTEDGSYVERV
jgi:elongation factor P